MYQIKYVIPALLLLTAVLATGQIKNVSACSIDDLGGCFSAATGGGGGYYAGQQDAIYDHSNNLAYNPNPQCCHPDDWNSQFSSGYENQWNQYQSQSANVNVENSPGATVNIGQNQNQNPIDRPVGCSDDCSSGNPNLCSGPCGGGSCSDSCGGPSVCDSGCGNFGPYYHHFGWFHFHHFGYGPHFGGFGFRHVAFGEDP
jgi:hypothetical protein